MRFHGYPFQDLLDLSGRNIVEGVAFAPNKAHTLRMLRPPPDGPADLVVWGGAGVSFHQEAEDLSLRTSTWCMGGVENGDGGSWMSGRFIFRKDKMADGHAHATPSTCFHMLMPVGSHLRLNTSSALVAAI